MTYEECGSCGERFRTCDSHYGYTYCENCDGVLCPGCMERLNILDGNMTENCCLCQAKEVNDKGLLAFLLNKLGISREEAQAEFEKKHGSIRE